MNFYLFYWRGEAENMRRNIAHHPAPTPLSDNYYRFTKEYI